MHWLFFGKKSKAPFYFYIARHLGEIVDGITGLIMSPFNRYGTEFSYMMCVETLRWQTRNRKKNENTTRKV